MTTITPSQEQQVLDQVPKQLYIAGEWRDGAKGTLAVEDPSTAEPLCVTFQATGSSELKSKVSFGPVADGVGEGGVGSAAAVVVKVKSADVATLPAESLLLTR